MFMPVCHWSGGAVIPPIVYYDFHTSGGSFTNTLNGVGRSIGIFFSTQYYGPLPLLNGGAYYGSIPFPSSYDIPYLNVGDTLQVKLQAQSCNVEDDVGHIYTTLNDGDILLLTCTSSNPSYSVTAIINGVSLPGGPFAAIYLR